MEKERKNIREPYQPDDTPKPPQIIDPEKRDERKHPVKEDPANRREEKKGEKPGREEKKGEKPGKDEKGHLLSEKADIDDETTI